MYVWHGKTLLVIRIFWQKIAKNAQNFDKKFSKWPENGQKWVIFIPAIPGNGKILFPGIGNEKMAGIPGIRVPGFPGVKP